MVTYLLVITLHIAGTVPMGGPGTVRMIVSSPEVAAVELWRRNEEADQWSTYRGELLKIDHRAWKVEKVEIPRVRFDAP